MAAYSKEARSIALRASRRLHTVPDVDFRSLVAGDADTTVHGHAAHFNSLSADLGGFREMLSPGAFRSALRKQPDVRLLFNHNADYVMARSSAGTLQLAEDATGLAFNATVDTGIGWIADLRRSMQRGDVTNCSFAFTLITNGGEEWDDVNGTVVRTVLPDGVDDLFDVSVVTYPAYEAPTASIRSTITTRRLRLDEQRRRLRGATP